MSHGFDAEGSIACKSSKEGTIVSAVGRWIIERMKSQELWCIGHVFTTKKIGRAGDRNLDLPQDEYRHIRRHAKRALYHWATRPNFKSVFIWLRHLELNLITVKIEPAYMSLRVSKEVFRIISYSNCDFSSVHSILLFCRNVPARLQSRKWIFKSHCYPLIPNLRGLVDKHASHIPFPDA